MHLTQSYQRENSMITDRMRSQGKYDNSIRSSLFHFIGEDAFTCWAYSCASMMRTSCMRLIRQCHRLGIINDQEKRLCEEFILSEKVHVQMRNLAMMILLPRKLHVDDDTQGAYLRAAISRVKN